MKNFLKLIGLGALGVLVAALLFSALAPAPVGAQSTAPTLGESAGLTPAVTVIACTNRVPDNVTESTEVGSAIDMGSYRYLGVTCKFALHAAGTETCTFNFATAADGTNYTTSGRPSLGIAANGTTAVVTNFVIDCAGIAKVKLLNIICGNTTTADMTNILVTATKRRTPY